MYPGSLEVHVLCMQPRDAPDSFVSKEERELEKRLDEDKLAIKALHGLAALTANIRIQPDLVKKLQHELQADTVQQQHSPPNSKPRRRTKRVAQGLVQTWDDRGSGKDDSGDDSADYDSEGDDIGKSSRKTETKEQRECLDLISAAASKLLQDDPAGVLDRMLRRLRSKGNERLVRNTSAFTLAMLSSMSELKHKLGALDIEKLTLIKSLEKSHPSRLNKPATLLAEVKSVAEIGVATEQGTGACKVAETLAKKDEATTGMAATGEPSPHYRTDSKAVNVNSRVFAGVEDSSRGPDFATAETAQLATERCLKQLDSKVILTYNSSGFDETPLYRALLGDSPQSIWQAVQQLLDTDSIPAFCPAYWFVSLLASVLWKKLSSSSSNHKGLMQRAKLAKLKNAQKLQKMERAFEVQSLATHDDGHLCLSAC